MLVLKRGTNIQFLKRNLPGIIVGGDLVKDSKNDA